MSYEYKKVTIVVLTMSIMLILLFFLSRGNTSVYCEFEYDTPYVLEYLNAPSSYRSETHKVIWRANGCGNNIEDMYRIEAAANGSESCTVTMVEEKGGPFFILTLPVAVEKYCPAKPPEHTPVPNE